MVSRERVKLLGKIFVGLSAILILFTLLQTQSKKEGELREKYSSFQIQMDDLMAQQKTFDTGSSQYMDILKKMADLHFEAESYYDTIEKMRHERNLRQMIFLISSAACSVFWIPCFLYLFLVKSVNHNK